MTPRTPASARHRGARRARSPNLWWSWSREARSALPLDRRRRSGISRRHNPIDLLLPGRSRPARRLRQRPRLPAPVRRGHGAHGRRARPAPDTWFAPHLPRPASTARSPTSAPSSGSTTRCRSTPAASASSPATTARRPPTSGVPLVGVGLFYMKGYFDQRLRLDGWQEDSDEDVRHPAARRSSRCSGPNGEPWLATVRDLRAGRCTSAPGG